MREKYVWYKVFVGVPEGKRSLGRPRRKWEGYIKIEFKQTGLEYVHWIYEAQDSGSCDHGNDPAGSLKCWSFLDQLREK
jgi:hypothetical protein